MTIKFRNPVTGEYPVTPDMIRFRHRHAVSFGPTVTRGIAEALGYEAVEVAEEPAFNAATERLEALPVVVDGGVLRQGWQVVALPADEVAANLAAARQSLVDGVVAEVQQRLDAFARTRNYDGILSCATYATSTNPSFAAEGQRAVNLRDQTWTALYALMAAVEAGQRPMPSEPAEILAELPTLTW